MTCGKERILATLSGKTVDHIPFVPNIWQWFYVNQYNRTLPEEIRHTVHPVDVLRWMGADILSKFEGDVRTPTYHTCDIQVEFSGQPVGDQPPWASFTSFEGGMVRHETLRTPDGTLTHGWEYQLETGAPFETEHWWKDFDAEFQAVRYWMEDTEWTYDQMALEDGLTRIGNDGIIIFQLLPSPLKQFHWLAGQENASYFIMDHPDEIRALAKIHEVKSLEYLEQIVDLDDVWVFEVADNLDSAFYPPYWFKEFCVPVLRKMADMVHSRGKYLFIHACGHLKALAPQFLEAGIDCVEGQTPPPIGDWPLHEARALSNELIICGGMAAPEQELRGPDTPEKIDAYVRDLFATMGEKKRFLFGSSCNTSPATPLENLLVFRDAAWKYGNFTNEF